MLVEQGADFSQVGTFEGCENLSGLMGVVGSEDNDPRSIGSNTRLVVV